MKKLMAVGLLTGFLGLPAQLNAQDADKLKVARAKVSTVYKRLASVPATSAEIETWAGEYAAATDAAGKRAALAKVAAAAVANDNFYSKTVMNFADPETNEGEEILAQNLSDYTATIVGFIKDELDYRRILHDDIMYTATPTVTVTVPDPADDGNVAAVQLGPYSPTDNFAFQRLEEGVKRGQVELAASLTQVAQSATTGYAIQAGIYSLRGYGSVFYNDGTNRSPLRYTFINYLCRDMEELSDVTRPDIYVRRDVDRTPGGDGEKFRTECVGCHAGMDPMTKAFAFVDFDPDAAQITYGATPVAKVNRNNDTFPNGAVVEDDAWQNIWLEGTNAGLGWSKEITSGNGPKSWGQAMSETEMFPECMAERVYEVVCLRDSSTNKAKADISSLAGQFVQDGYNMKALFMNAAVTCGEDLNL
ncbi:hypothetical protein [Pseudobacteriovorax antillogorgiicola]|uniref:Cytochrome c domain-containing protein n=1 Tax=Pseudobacteriovorax antillogorgiicola TaxID=1513793 RepID=A0A1Y6C1J3_9BACT|nr:hypothetical protein [Pseudobacteriovorax antillogorgiicola]TCS52410.1 hypothetical protein EDD56_109155 [Pseudobacteriovorax antillogorgiicola]SMF28886.1 hypothetical protein SAMN06296036_10958 [Pseudobacteriovorax antillogorgiicola]